VVGRVTDAEGRPVEGAILGFTRFANARTRTDADGRYRFDHRRVGEERLNVLKPGLAPQARDFTTKATEPETRLDFTLQPRKTLSLRVTDRAGRGVEGVAVSPIDFYGLHEFGKSDAEGIWTWDFAPEEAIFYTLGKEGYMNLGGVTFTPGPEPSDVILPP